MAGVEVMDDADFDNWEICAVCGRYIRPSEQHACQPKRIDVTPVRQYRWIPFYERYPNWRELIAD